MILFIIIIIYFLIIVFDYKGVIQKKSKKVFYIYSTILVVTFVIMVLDSYNVQLPSPSMIIEQVILSFTKG